MNLAVKIFSVQNHAALPAILWAGLACGVLDITAALLVYSLFGIQPIRLLQGIAGGLLGPQTYEGGLLTALLGLLCHFLIAFSAAAVYVAVSSWSASSWVVAVAINRHNAKRALRVSVPCI